MSPNPPIRRLKTYTGAQGYVYQYYFVGKRPALPDDPEAPATEFVFDVTSDRDVEYDFEHAKSQQHHHAEQGKQRHDLGDDDFSRAGGRHQQLLHRPSFALSHHGRGCNQRTVHNQQETENTGRNEPGINQAWVVDESRHELHLPPAAYLGRSNLLKAGMNAHALQPGVVSLNDAFRIGLADGGRIRVRGV